MTDQLHVGATRLTFDLRPAGRGELKTAGFIFQHGMGGDTAQPLGYLGDTPPVPVAALSARGHAPSDDLTDPAKVNWRGSAAEASFDTFADDVIALADHLGLDRFAIGGISLGAGTALNLALRHPDRVTALVLCRPAWLDHPQADFNQAAYREIADLLDAGGDIETLAARYRRSDTYQYVRSVSPAAAASLLGQITRPRAAYNTLLLRAFPGSSPTRSAHAWTKIKVPTLVIGHRGDPFHPYDIAEAYADAIPKARLCTVPSKDADQAGFADQIRIALHSFLTETMRS